MAYEGTERRANCRMDVCSAHESVIIHNTEYTAKLDNLIATVNEMKDTIKEAVRLRVSWWVAILGIIFAMILQVVATVFFAGQMYNQIKVNTDRLTRIEHTIYDETGVYKKTN